VALQLTAARRLARMLLGWRHRIRICPQHDRLAAELLAHSATLRAAFEALFQFGALVSACLTQFRTSPEG
jgi:hypothetical protein